ncbi:MAG TPA: TetR/AcrR family transcriptional regulator [Caulobacteraceae bacterium]|nr:TetR/AcrR family transcriptional regulator [Caulobacteraceae bacterium]
MPRTLSQTEIEDFRHRLCDAAEHLFAERGAEGVTIRELAAAVGVSPMTPYRYFKDKDAILAAVRARAFDRHAGALEAAYAATAGDRSARPGALADAYVRFAEENPEAYKLMFDVRQPSAGDYPELVRAGARSYRTMTLQLSNEIAAGRLSGDPAKIGQMYWAALHGALMLEMSGLLGRKEARALIHDLLATLDKGLWGEARPGI